MENLTPPNETEASALQSRYTVIHKSLHGAQLLAVSKEQPAWKIQTLFEKCGHKSFGENRLTALKERLIFLPNTINWTYLGMLQSSHWRFLKNHPIRLGTITNEDPLDWAHAKPPVQPISCLIQVALEPREDRLGVDLKETEKLIQKFLNQKHLKLTGFLFMPLAEKTLAERKAQFSDVYQFFKIQKKNYRNRLELNTLSQGMSDDYGLALEEGATEVRLGTLLFGERLR